MPSVAAPWPGWWCALVRPSHTWAGRPHPPSRMRSPRPPPSPDSTHPGRRGPTRARRDTQTRRRPRTKGCGPQTRARSGIGRPYRRRRWRWPTGRLRNPATGCSVAETRIRPEKSACRWTWPDSAAGCLRTPASNGRTRSHPHAPRSVASRPNSPTSRGQSSSRNTDDSDRCSSLFGRGIRNTDRVILAQRFDVRGWRCGRRAVEIGGAGGGHAPRGGHGGYVIAVDRTQRLVYQRAFRGHRAAHTEDARDFVRRDDLVVFVAVRPAQDQRIVYAGLHLLLQRGLEERLHIRIEDIRMARQQRHIVAFKHRQNGQTAGVAGPFAEARESPCFHALDGEVRSGGLPRVAAVFADHVPGVEGDAGDARIAPVAVTPR